MCVCVGVCVFPLRACIDRYARHLNTTASLYSVQPGVYMIFSFSFLMNYDLFVLLMLSAYSEYL